jgi:glycosidase
VDNHDVARIMEVTNGDAERARLALTILLTTRGIPEIYYGTEIALRGGRDHGTIRSDFPGGFSGDARSAFTPAGRTAGQDSMFQFVRTLLHLRKEHPALTRGSLVQFPAVDNMYAYVRSSGEDRILVLTNNNAEPKGFKLSQVKDQLGTARTLKGLFGGKVISLEGISEIAIPGNTAGLFEIEGS